MHLASIPPLPLAPPPPVGYPNAPCNHYPNSEEQQEHPGIAKRQGASSQEQPCAAGSCTAVPDESHAAADRGQTRPGVQVAASSWQLCVHAIIGSQVWATDTFDSKTHFAKVRFGIKSGPDVHRVMFSAWLLDITFCKQTHQLFRNLTNESLMHALTTNNSKSNP